MLLNIDCSIVQSIKISLTFDNNKVKEQEISVGDFCTFEFNKNGKRDEIEGKVIKIVADNTVDTKSWYIVVDGSLSFSGKYERFSPTQILDINIIQKHDSKNYIGTPNDSNRITDMKIVDGYLMVSTDGGYSYFRPKNGNRPHHIIDNDFIVPSKEPYYCNCGIQGQYYNKPVEIEGDDDVDFSDNNESN